MISHPKQYLIVALMVITVWGLLILDFSPIEGETPASNNIYVILASISERLSNLENAPIIEREYQEFSGETIVNATGTSLSIQCGTDYPYYQYDSGFSRGDGGLVTIQSHSVIWDGDNDVWTTEFVSMFGDTNVTNSIACSNIP